MDSAIQQALAATKWESQFSGRWPPVDLTRFGEFYSRMPFADNIKRYVHQTIITWHDGTGAGFQPIADKKRFSEELIAQIAKDPALVDKLCMLLKKTTDEFMAVFDELMSKDVSLEEFQRLHNNVLEYYPYHIQVKVLVDYLPAELLKKYLPQFEDARVYAEPLFTKFLEFTMQLSAFHEKKTGYPAKLIRAMTKDEFEQYLQDGTLPDRAMLEQRNKQSAFYFHEGKMHILLGDDVTKAEELVLGKQSDEIEGQTAYPGTAKGRVQIVHDPDKAKDFKPGDILVAGMTRPEYVPLIEKSAAFVTDGGGVLCHAAIVARELKKPCVIGTQRATKDLNDGDIVEVDAEKGVVRKIE